MSECGARIAVVEDDESLNPALERLLRSAGFEPLMFSSAEEFLESYTPNAAACLILDVNLPGLSGVDLQSKLHHEQLPVIFITADDNPVVKVRAEKSGARGYLSKPFDVDQMLSVIAAVLEQAPRPSEEPKLTTAR